MSIYPWIFFAFLSAFAMAGNALLNEYFKVRSLYLLFWMRSALILFLLPVVLHIAAPTNPLFYLCVLGTTICFSYSDLIYFSKAADSGAGLITRFEGLSVGMTFLLWLVIDPTVIDNYIAQPLKGIGIICAFIGTIYFALRLRKCTISFGVLKQMFPALCIGALGVVFGKLAMIFSDYHSGVWYYAFVQSVFVLCVYIMILNVPLIARYFPATHAPDGLFHKKTFIAGACLALGWAVYTPSKYYAITDVENPAYVTLIGLTTPFWVLLIYKLIRKEEKGDILSGLGIVICAILLVIFTRV